MVPKPFWERQWSSHLNEREKEETISTMRRNGQVRWPKVIVKYSGLKSYVPTYSPETPRQLENRVMPLHDHVGRVVHPDTRKKFGCSSPGAANATLRAGLRCSALPVEHGPLRAGGVS